MMNLEEENFVKEIKWATDNAHNVSAEAACKILKILQETQDELHKHTGVEGGVAAECGHPVQCLYACARVDSIDGESNVGCSMCDQKKVIKRLNQLVRGLKA